VRINTSDREVLLRVPGLGPDTVGKILKARKERRIKGLRTLGVRGKRVERVNRYVVYD